MSSKSDHEILSERILKITIMGKPAVGKTSLRRSFMGEKFRQNYLPTLGADFSLYTMKYSQQLVKTTLWDLSGQPRFHKVHPQYYVGAHGAIVLYDIHSEKPEDELINWIDKYLEHVGKYIGKVMIVQNKIDLIDSQHEAIMAEKHERIVQNIGIYFKNRIQIVSGRTSALTGEGVDQALNNFIQFIVDDLSDGQKRVLNEEEQQNNYTLASYLVTFENLIGPVIVLKSPVTLDMNYSQEEESSIVNVSAGLNLEELAKHQFETGTAMWTDPESIFHHIAFVIQNENARGGFDLYILGVNISRDLRYFVSDQQSLIRGYLINAMNKFSDFLNSTDYILNDEQDLIRLYQSKPDYQELLQILEDLRDKIDGIIKEKLEKS